MRAIKDKLYVGSFLGVGLLVIVAVLGPFAWMAWSATPHISGRETDVTAPAKAALNGKMVLLCVGDRQDLVYLYQNLKGEPAGIAVVPRGCASTLP